LLFPRALVEDTIAKAARHFVLHGQHPRNDLEPWGRRYISARRAAQTLKLMQSEYVYPVVGDRASPSEWAEKGSRDVVQRAASIVDHILATHFPHHLHGDVDRQIRERFPVRLSREHMLTANG
jgi:trimethylamine:corrinoid methyltransferase-like protein